MGQQQVATFHNQLAVQDVNSFFLTHKTVKLPWSMRVSQNTKAQVYKPIADTTQRYSPFSQSFCPPPTPLPFISRRYHSLLTCFNQIAASLLLLSPTTLTSTSCPVNSLHSLLSQRATNTHMAASVSSESTQLDVIKTKKSSTSLNSYKAGDKMEVTEGIEGSSQQKFEVDTTNASIDIENQGGKEQPLIGPKAAILLFIG